METKITYVTDSVEGTSLVISKSNHGWVEYAKESYYIYASKTFPVDLYKKTYETQISMCRSAGHKLVENAGFASHLEHVIQEKGFLLPLFAIFDKEKFQVTCGNSRFLAHMTSGQDPSSIGLVIFSKEKIDRNDLVELTSSQDFVDFYDLSNIDFSIEMEFNEDKLVVKSSSLRHTFYNDREPTTHVHIKRLHHDIQEFWLRYVNEDTKRFSLVIHCLPEHRRFVNKSPLFDVTFVDEGADIWEFSFGKLLGAFRPTEQEKINYKNRITMWLFDPTENFDLELFLPLLNVNSTCVYTRNEKAVMFNQNFYSDFKIIGNIVK